MPTIQRLAGLALLVLACPLATLRAQDVTTGSMTGTVTDPQDRPVPGASVTALHEPSGTRYEAVSRADGRFTIRSMRVGGPYTATVTLRGFRTGAQREVIVNLGVATELSLRLTEVTATEDVTVTARPDVFGSAHTGASATIGRPALATLPTIADRLNDFTRLTPQFTGGPGAGGAYAGADNRLNNIAIDGSYFNTFGLSGQPGERTGVAPISTEALAEIQVNVAPYDVRHGHFVGAGVNSVTRSGDNTLRASAYYRFRDDSLVGTEARGLPFDPGTFRFDKWGGWVSGRVTRDRLFFFLSHEDESLTSPGTPFRANAGGETVQGNTTRVLASDLDALSGYLRSNFGYETGPYQGYDHLTPASRYLAKLDYNVDGRNTVSLRYAHLDSSSDALLSNAPALGFGNRRSNTTGLNFQNSNYHILENIRSMVGQWNRVLGAGWTNTAIVGYAHQDESRASPGRLFPMVDILEQGAVYTTLGSEPFTPGNELRYDTFQVQDSFAWNRGSHAFAVGASAERYHSENSFFPASQGIYVYNSLADFYTDANDHLARPNRTTSPVTLRRFQQRWMNVPGLETPIQPLKVWYTGLFAQDEWRAGARFTLTYGVRFDVPSFADSRFRNAEADALTFRDDDGSAVRYRTDELPDAKVLWSPRVGFNWSLDGQSHTRVRGGTGVFTGRPAYVWISSQLGTNGVLTGFEQLDNTRLRPFNPSPDAYKPMNVTGAPASTYDLALTDPGFRFPQVWRSNLALDRRLPWGVMGTVEGLYTRDVNGVQYINANLPAAQTRLVGADDRPRWTSNRIHPHVVSAIVLGNQDDGHAWHVSATLSKSHRAGFLRAAYAYSRSRSPAEPGALPVTSWIAGPHSGDPNNVGAPYFAHGHRALLAGSRRLEYLKLGATTVSFFLEGRHAGNASYTYAGDLNGDGGTANDLLYVPRDVSEMNFQAFTSGGRTFTAAEQAAAWSAYIDQDRYLRRRRGRYAERNGVLLPMVWRLDVAVAQELFATRGARRHALQLRADVLNFANLLESDWGVGQRLVNPQSLTNASVDVQGRATYRLRVVGEGLMSRSLEPSSTLFDVYRIQISVKYSFN